MPKTVLKAVGRELRIAREASGLSQQDVADVFDWRRNAISKLERGDLNISLYQYLDLVRFSEDFLPPDHAGVALADHYMPRSRPRRNAG